MTNDHDTPQEDEPIVTIWGSMSTDEVQDVQDVQDELPTQDTVATGDDLTPPKLLRGRQLKFTPEIAERIIKLLEDGVSRSVAAGAVGISYDTLGRWLRLGRAGNELFVQFVTDVKKAEKASEAYYVDKVKQAADGGAVVRRISVTKVDKAGNTTTTVTEDVMPPQWQAAAWKLERTYPERWGRDKLIIEDLKRIYREEQASKREREGERTRG